MMCGSVATVSEACALLVFLFLSFTVGGKKSVREKEKKGITRFLEIDAMQLF